MQKLLSSIVESTDDAIIGKDPEGVILSWNRAAEMMYGYPANEIIGKSITCIIPHDKYAEYKKIINQIRNGQGVSNLETQRICKDRSLIDVSLTISPIFGEHGILSGISTISRNISSRKAEQRLLQSEEKYRALVENMNVGVYRSTGDPRGKFVWGNPSLVEILGYSSFDQLEKIRVSEIFVENNGRKKHLDELNRTGFVKNKELSLKRADGSVIWVSVTALAQFNPDGKIEFINGIVEDITAMKQISQEMGDLRKEFFEVIHYFPDAVVIIDAQKKVIAWNPALEKLTGVLQENILGKTGYAGALPFFDSHHPVLMDLIDEPDDKIRTHYPNVILKDRSLVAEFFVSSMNNGTGAYLWTKAAPLMDREGHRLGAVEFIRDITERKKIDACLKRTIISPRGRDTEETGINRALSDGLPLLSGTHSLVYSFYLSQALKNNPDYLTILDNAGKCLWANDAFLSLMHEKGGDFHPGNNLVYYVAPEFRKKILTCLSDVRKDGHKSLPIMFFIGTRRIPVDVTISVIHDFNNDILGFLAIARRETGSG
jgi:PAS domain S-box-containing protein